jgi:hypothetical protein
MSVRDGLLRMRDETLQRLHALARTADKRVADKLFDELQILDRAVNSTSSETESYRYARHKSAILAILAYLDDVGRPVSQRDLVDALLNGGWRRGNEKAETQLKQGIAAFATGKGLKTKQIKIVNGLIGRGEWDDSRFVNP